MSDVEGIASSLPASQSEAEGRVNDVMITRQHHLLKQALAARVHCGPRCDGELAHPDAPVGQGVQDRRRRDERGSRRVATTCPPRAAAVGRSSELPQRVRGLPRPAPAPRPLPAAVVLLRSRPRAAPTRRPARAAPSALPDSALHAGSGKRCIWRAGTVSPPLQRRANRAATSTATDRAWWLPALPASRRSSLRWKQAARCWPKPAPGLQRAK